MTYTNRHHPDADLAIISAWIDQLRSGEHTQGRGALERALFNQPDQPDRVDRCCLGVLESCSAVSQALPMSPPEQRAVDRGGIVAHDYAYAAHSVVGSDANSGSLTDATMHWAGLESEHGTGDVSIPAEDFPGFYDYHFPQRRATADPVTLIELNDSYGFTFEEIADVLEMMFFTGTYEPTEVAS